MIFRANRLVAYLVITLPLISADITFNTTIVPEGYMTTAILPSAPLSQACVAAWARPIACTEWLGRTLGASSDAERPSASALNELCTDQCIESLRSWRDGIRADCNAEDIKNANSTEWDPRWVGSFGGRENLLVLLDTTVFAVETAYYTTCLRDLSSNILCELLGPGDLIKNGTWPKFSDTEPTSELAAGFCKSTCMTQYSVFDWDIGSTIYGKSDTTIGNARILCPDLDTSNFPFLSLASPSPSLSRNNTSSPPPATNTSSSRTPNQTSATSAVGPDENAAGSLKVIPLMWWVGSVLMPVVVGYRLL